MRPPSRKNRTTNNPGLIDLPQTRRSSADLVAERQKKKEIADAKAKVKNAKLEQVARVEKEIKVAQKEAGQVGNRGRVKKTFERETPAKEANTVRSP